MTMQEQFPTISAYIVQTIAPMVDAGAELLMRDYPNLVELRAREVSAAQVLLAYMKELDAWRKLASSKTLTSAQIDEFDFDRMDQEEIDGGLYRVLEALTGHRSLGIDIDTIQIYGFDKLDLGVYEPNWREVRQANLDKLHREREEARALAESEKEVYAPVSYIYLHVFANEAEKRAYYEPLLNYALEELEKLKPDNWYYPELLTYIAKLKEKLGY
jgi:hypothetical protein